jgi:hypothetical protein
MRGTGAELIWSERDNMSEMAFSQRGEIHSKQKEYFSGRSAHCFQQPGLWHGSAAPLFDNPKLKKSSLFASERIWLQFRFHRNSIGIEEMKPIAIMVNARKCDLPTIGEWLIVAILNTHSGAANVNEFMWFAWENPFCSARSHLPIHH